MTTTATVSLTTCSSQVDTLPVNLCVVAGSCSHPCPEDTTRLRPRDGAHGASKGRAPASEQSIEWSWGWGGECGEFPVMGEAGAPAASPDQRLGGAGWGNAFLPEAATAHALRQL